MIPIKHAMKRGILRKINIQYTYPECFVISSQSKFMCQGCSFIKLYYM